MRVAGGSMGLDAAGGTETGAETRPPRWRAASRRSCPLRAASGDPTLRRTPTHPANGYGLVRRRAPRLLLMLKVSLHPRSTGRIGSVATAGISGFSRHLATVRRAMGRPDPRRIWATSWLESGLPASLAAMRSRGVTAVVRHRRPGVGPSSTRKAPGSSPTPPRAIGRDPCCRTDGREWNRPAMPAG